MISEIHRRFAPFGERRLAWEDALALAATFGVTVQVGKSRIDSVLTRRLGRPRIVVSDRLHLESWGVFCAVHEIGHWLMHPGKMSFYADSPGWSGKIESQASTIALLALWPHPAPRPRILKLDERGGAMHLLVAFTTESRYDLSARWTSRLLTLQRYRG